MGRSFCGRVLCGEMSAIARTSEVKRDIVEPSYRAQHRQIIATQKPRADTSFPKSCTYLFLRNTRNNGRIPEFERDITGSIEAATTKPQSTSRKGPSQIAGRVWRSYEEPRQMDVERSSHGRSFGIGYDHSPCRTVRSVCAQRPSCLRSSLPWTGICVGSRLLRRRILDAGTLELCRRAARLGSR